MTEAKETINQSDYVGKILVIDDEETIRKTLSAILKRNHYKVETAESYAVIKEKLFKENYDALILDIILPEVDGIEILHNINKAELNLPTLMLTGAPSLDTAKESVKYGAFDYLTKPVDQSVLLNQLKNAINKKRLVDSKKKLMQELRNKNDDLEKLVDQRTEELRISEIRSRIIIEAVHDMIIITDPESKIKFTNVVFFDMISEGINEDLHFEDVIDNKLDDYIKSFGDMNMEEVIGKVRDGQEFDFINTEFQDTLNINGEFKSSVRGIFDEDLELQEIIIIIGKKD